MSQDGVLWRGQLPHPELGEVSLRKLGRVWPSRVWEECEEQTDRQCSALGQEKCGGFGREEVHGWCMLIHFHSTGKHRWSFCGVSGTILGSWGPMGDKHERAVCCHGTRRKQEEVWRREQRQARKDHVDHGGELGFYPRGLEKHRRI